jgi:hypothetical protein
MELQRNLGLALTPGGKKLVIEVTVERVTGAPVTPQWTREPLIVPSPALYLAPVELDDNTILAQSIAIPMIDYMVGQTINSHAVLWNWRPLLLGMRLWQLWDVDVPLAHWRYDVVNWLYTDVPATSPKQSSLLSESYTELCAMHSLWMLSPKSVGIPFECAPSDAGIWSTRWQSVRMPPIYLDRLSVPDLYYQHHAPEDYLSYSAEAVIIATLIEYAVDAYGYDHLPVLLDGLAQYESWDTLIPAVYGVSRSEFEQGWQAYLAKEYDIRQER